jgi:uncharacterized protein
MEWRKSGDDYVIRVDRGEEIMSTLTGLLTQQDIRSGSIVGIGAVEETVLGYYDARSGEYLRKSFPEEAELVVFAGNVTLVDGAPFIHAHAVISDASFQALSGHFFSGVIAVTGEFQLHRNAVDVRRELDAGIGLKLMRFE